MTKQFEVYKCEVCGNIVEVLHAGPGGLVCCGQDMTLQEEKTADAANEKHVPVIEKTDKGYLVKVGSVPHPMVDEHYIEWIELQCCHGMTKVYLKPGDKPEAEFDDCGCGSATAREHCSVHGLWKS